MILITHNLGVVAEICDSVCVIYCGKTVEYGSVFDVFDKPAHPYTIGLLKSVLSIEQFRENLSAIEGMVPNLMNPPTGCPFHPRCEYRERACSSEQPPKMSVSPGHYFWCWRTPGQTK
ncbi:MAG: ABC transporter ATP-binding protein [Deltaproteobacteria bacterium]|nr:ABC transporter ATP-binding protein [Deltaproteobacteria bacterium]